MNVYIVADIKNGGGIINAFLNEEKAKKYAETVFYPFGGPFYVYTRKLEIMPLTKYEERLILLISEFNQKDDVK